MDLLERRQRLPEIMDQPGLDPTAHRRALDGLARVNVVSRTAMAIWRALNRALGRPQRLRVLDVACGGGDVTIALWSLARRAGVQVQMKGIDISGPAIERAREKAECERASVCFEKGDALTGRLEGGYDVVMSSLFLHHLDETDAVRLLRTMAAASRGLVIIDELNRSPTGYLLALLGTRLLSRSRVVHVDGPRSVRSAFSTTEVAELARQAALGSVQIQRRWPSRWMLIARPA